MIQTTSKPQHSLEATHQGVGDEAIIINLTTGAYYSLNDTGAMFWKMLDGQRTIADCARLIAEKYEVDDVAMVEADLLELATEFSDEGLIIV